MQINKTTEEEEEKRVARKKQEKKRRQEVDKLRHKEMLLSRGMRQRKGEGGDSWDEPQ